MKSECQSHQLSCEQEHSVSELMKMRVQQELKRIEQVYQVKILYACESGSRGWGFASPDSDYDVRFIYAHQPEWYLRVESPKDVIERPLDDELDISGWELRKTLHLLKAGNPTLLEWVDSPIVYRIDADFYQRLMVLVPKCFSTVKAQYHYLSMAKKNFHSDLQGEQVRFKKYLYVLRPLLATKWIEQNSQVPPIRFSELLTLIKDPQLLEEITQLLKLKSQAGETKYADRMPLIDNFIAMELERSLATIEKAQRNNQRSPVADLDRLLYDTVIGHNHR